MVARVVIVDNDPDATELVATDLRHEGYEVVGTAANGEDALLVCEQTRPDVAIVDFRMAPGPDGISVARTLRDRRLAGAVVIYSNYQSREIVDAAAAVGARFVAKGSIRRLRDAVAALTTP